ncbi:uncharacterized protein LOC127811605 [Diospyros lotus]|uniref:uncharacterized protein LOC127811605 n=1 Tax=Diospyros lotus TaxID=55363 RepID=UPI00224FEF8E|nr:uncharacterized protein LOC127811605 [Diospyros lotus]
MQHAGRWIRLTRSNGPYIKEREDPKGLPKSLAQPASLFLSPFSLLLRPTAVKISGDPTIGSVIRHQNPCETDPGIPNRGVEFHIRRVLDRRRLRIGVLPSQDG